MNSTFIACGLRRNLYIGVVIHMLYKFDTNKAIHTLLFLIQSLGGKAEAAQLLRLLYFADKKHLSRYGSLILGDVYMSMKNGPVPCNTFLLFQKIVEKNSRVTFEYDVREYFFNEQGYVERLQDYDNEVLSKSEAMCLFEAIREHKCNDLDTMARLSMDDAWAHANIYNELSVIDMAKTEQTPEVLIQYIEACMDAERNMFRTEMIDPAKNLLVSPLKIGGVLKEMTEEDTVNIFIVAGLSFTHYALVKLICMPPANLLYYHQDHKKSFVPLHTLYEFSCSQSVIDCSHLYVRGFSELNTWFRQHPDRLIGELEEEDKKRIMQVLRESDTLSEKVKTQFLF